MNSKLYLIVIFCLLSLGAAEFGARFYGLGRPPLTKTHPIIEYYFLPQQELTRFGSRIAINKFGMRSDDIQGSLLNPRHQRVLVFGDSVVFGGSQMDQASIATTILQQRLRNNDPTVEVLNISAGSWGPGNWRGYAKTYGLFGATDVILVISSHDATDNPSFAPLNPNTHPSSNPPFALYELFSRYLWPRLILSQVIGSSSRRARDEQSENEAQASLLQSLKIGLADLDAFLAIAENSGARVAIVQFWDRAEVESGKANFGHQEIFDVLRRRNVEIVQSYELFKDCSSYPGRDLFSDGIHPYTLAGQQCLADSLQLALERSRQLR